MHRSKYAHVVIDAISIVIMDKVIDGKRGEIATHFIPENDNKPSGESRKCDDCNFLPVPGSHRYTRRVHVWLSGRLLRTITTLAISFHVQSIGN